MKACGTAYRASTTPASDAAAPSAMATASHQPGTIAGPDGLAAAGCGVVGNAGGSVLARAGSACDRGVAAGGFDAGTASVVGTS